MKTFLNCRTFPVGDHWVVLYKLPHTHARAGSRQSARNRLTIQQRMRYHAEVHGVSIRIAFDSRFTRMDRS